MGDIKNYVKIHEAVQAFCEWSLPSIETCIRQWHQAKQGTLTSCQQPSTCPSNKKPTAKSKACQSCIDWRSAVEGECYPPGRDVQWKNVNANVLYKDAVEVAKGFVFILPHAQSCASFDEFDIGGILKMMMGFKDYHGGDQACVQKIQKVVDIRNNLSHMKVQQQMNIPDAQTSDYFQNIKDLVTELEGRHALLQFNTIMTLLNKIQQSDMSDMTDGRIQQAMKPLTDGLHQALGELKLIKEEIGRLQPKQGDRKSEDLFDVQAVRKQLMTEYKQTRSRVQLLPGVPEECASMDEIFVDMTLCEQQNDSSVRHKGLQTNDDPQGDKVKSRKLESHNDLLTIKDKRGQTMKHILVRGDPGCGKSTLISKIAYDWAKNEDPKSLYAQFQLVFAIDFKEVLPEMDLFDAIADQLLPKVSKQDLERFIERNSESVLFLFDGFDETYSSFPDGCRDFKSVLSGTLFSESFVIMTTRPHKVAAINAKYKINYTHVEVFGLPILSIFKYVAQFFDVCLEYINYINRFSTSWLYRGVLQNVLKIDPPANHKRKAENVASFLVHILESEHLLHICRYPMILTMVCFSWDDDQDLSLILTTLYREAVVHVAQNRCKENSDGEIDVEGIRKDVDQLLLKVGKIALDGLLQDKLIFKAAEFDDDTLKDACNVGLVSKENKRSKLVPVVHVLCIHKTYQEMSAAYYWASLAESDESLFRSYQKEVKDMEDNEMVLRFCCGESVTAAESIIRGAVEKSCKKRRHVNKSKSSEEYFLGHYLKEFDLLRLPLLLLFEVDQKVGKNEAKYLHSLLRPLVCNLSIAAVCNERNGEVWAVLKSFSSKIQSDPGRLTWFASVIEVIVCGSSDGKGFSHGRNQFLEKVPAVSVAVPLMSNLKKLIICHGIHVFDCSCLLQNMAHSPTASKVLKAFVLHSYNFQPQAMANFLHQQTCRNTLQIGEYCGQITVRDSEEIIVNAVVNALKQQHLKVLVLDDMGINCKKVFDMLSKVNRAVPLTKLSLQRSCMGDGSVESFAEAVHFLPDLKTLNLRHLFLKEYGIEEKDFKVFGPALRYLQNLTELDIGGHTIGNSVKEFSQGLQYLTKLQKLILFRTGLMGDITGFLPFEYLTGLRTLCLGGNKIGNGIAKLSQKLKFLTNLREFEFGLAELTDDDVALLPLSSFKQLISLDLGDNALWSEGLCIIAKQLKNMPELQKLRVNGQQSSVSDEVSRGIRHAKGVAALLDSLASMSHISKAVLPGMCASKSDFYQSQEFAIVRKLLMSRGGPLTGITHNGQEMVKTNCTIFFSIDEWMSSSHTSLGSLLCNSIISNSSICQV